ncbi:MAG TPA: aldose epimerase family protein [Bacteroidales bacterium]|nr:aldose epimerase family protein [Bacteroidales bacterium]
MMKTGLLLEIILVIVYSTSCNQPVTKQYMVKKELFGMHQGKEVYLLTLKNIEGNVIRLNNYGARITWIEIPDRNGERDNITFGYDTFEATIKGDRSFGSVLGRFAGGISKGKFTLDGVEYSLTRFSSWTNVVWDTKILEDSDYPAVRFTYVSPDMEDGFPGTVNVAVTYTWTDKNEIIIDYQCSTDRKTVLNITNHAYFNLNGAGVGDILDHEVVIKASAFTPVDSFDLPTGEIRHVAGTPFDFTTPHTVGERINDTYEQLITGKGYDHNFILDNTEEVDATVYEPISGRLLEVITDQPGIVFYTGNYLDGTKKKGYGEKPYNYRSALCLESGHFPDSPNHPDFPSTVLEPGETFKSTTIYRFSVK